MLVATIAQDDFVANPAFKGWELLNGVPTERKKNVRANATVATVLQELGSVADALGGSALGPNQLFGLWGQRPDHLRAVDASYYRFSLAVDFDIDVLELPPDIAVEVVSPGLPASELERKRVELIQAGVEMIWVLYPATQTLHVHTRDKFAVLSATTCSMAATSSAASRPRFLASSGAAEPFSRA
ncbi:MAG: Uma2 family endonuclease [Dehalococcoidia bacterium]